MLILKSIEKETFDKYIAKNKNSSHFLQSLSWGEFSKVKRNLTPYYLGLVNENNELVAATLLLEKRLPLNFCCLYAPKGFVLDYNKKDILKELTKKIITFTKKKKAILVKINPEIIKKTTTNLGKIVKNDNYDEIFNYFKTLGFKVKKNTTTQDKYTFRIDLTQSMEDIENNFSKSINKKIAKSKKLDTEVVIGTKNDIHELYNLIVNTNTNNQNKSIINDEDYYETLYEIFNGNKNSKATLFLGKIHFNKTIKVLEKDLKSINNQISILPIDNLSKSAREKLNRLTEQKENILNEIDNYKNYKKEYGNDLTLCAQLIIEYNDKAWVIYSKNSNILKETYVDYNTYYENIKYCKEKGLKTLEQYEKNDKSFGGDCIEFMNELDYVTNKLMYFILKKIIKIKNI